MQNVNAIVARAETLAGHYNPRATQATLKKHSSFFATIKCANSAYATHCVHMRAMQHALQHTDSFSTTQSIHAAIAVAQKLSIRCTQARTYCVQTATRYMGSMRA